AVPKSTQMRASGGSPAIEITALSHPKEPRTAAFFRNSPHGLKIYGTLGCRQLNSPRGRDWEPVKSGNGQRLASVLGSVRVRAHSEKWSWRCRRHRRRAARPWL